MNESSQPQTRPGLDASFVVPIYNDGQLAHAFCEEFARVMARYYGTSRVGERAEIIFVDDGSVNDSWAHLQRVASQFDFVRAVCLSRNFGQHVAISCGYQYASGEYTGMLNVDMQDPPDQIPVQLDHLKSHDVDIVLGLYDHRSAPLFQRVQSAGFNWVLNKLTGTEVPLNMATLRIMNRQFREAYNRLTEKQRYIPALESWLGFRRAYLPIRSQPRREGRSSYHLRKRLSMAATAVVSFSDMPMRVGVVVGLCIGFIGFLLALGLIVGKLLFADYQPGYTSTVCLILLLGGAQIVFTGIASLYIGQIQREVQNRPLFVVRETCGVGLEEELCAPSGTGRDSLQIAGSAVRRGAC
jgi:glycosyltransferase involved in cell wall biosynthesis